MASSSPFCRLHRKKKIQSNLLDLKGEASTLDLFGTFHNKCNISFPDSQRRQLFFRLNRGKVRSFTRKGLKRHLSSFFGLINKNMKWLTKKKVLHVQLVPNIFKSRQRGFRSQSFRSEYLCHKFKSPLLWNISEERGILDPVWHSGDIYFVQTEC